MKNKNTTLHIAGYRWNEMTLCERGNWLQGLGCTAWQTSSWRDLPESIRELFVNHYNFQKAAYAFR